jgi:hypothetical protein
MHRRGRDRPPYRSKNNVVMNPQISLAGESKRTAVQSTLPARQRRIRKTKLNAYRFGMRIPQVILLERIVRNWIPFIATIGVLAGLVVDAYLLAGLAGFLP